MKKSLATLLFLGMVCSGVQAQDYLDLVKLSVNQATLGNVDTDAETDVSNTYAELYYPFPVSAKTTIIGGFTYENTRLGLGFTDARSNLIMTRLNLGLKLTHGKNWTGTYVFLPRLSSDFEGGGSDDFQVGGLALLEKRYSARKGLKFGTYVSSEEFGAIITPLVGFWYKSPNGKFYVNAILPIRSEAQYSLSERIGVGANLITSVKSYNIAEADANAYVQEESIRFNLFAGFEILDDELLVRAKLGFDTTDYGVYTQGDTVGAQVLTIPVGGDDRNRINSEFDSSIFYGVDLVFRMGI